ncbi:MAG: thiamine pyrophosphate-dependent dehydrogenase E1 component subunit alpha [Candidatus Rokubacteria bacterium]|nr:thiamine pyrophosphate-dependent dehydrogenase E1 component subunit alpha [Candidatus Rokubacteria bacterium]
MKRSIERNARVKPTDCLDMYRQMARIRMFEERAAELYRAGELPGFLHSSVGQEAVAVGVCAHLTPGDVITSTHRGHGHVIAKGARLDRMMAELYARETGYCRGKGGSMHIADLDLGILGANGIVGGGIPIAVGAALALRLRGERRVAVSFFGDGATNTGAFHEGLNLAAAWEVPCVFVCENNEYAESTSRRVHQRVKDVVTRAVAYDLPGTIADGMDVFSVYAVVGEAIARARQGRGPSFVEAKTYRFSGHHLGDPGTAYRSKEEVEVHRRRDPIKLFREKLVREGLASSAELEAIDGEVAAELEQAVRFARESPLPKPETALEDIYS